MSFKLRLLLIFISSLLIFLLTNSVIVAEQHHKTDVVMFGDSLTAGGKWDEIFTDINIVNLGRGGDAAYDMLKRINKVYEYNPKYCVIMAGFNDIDNYMDLDEIYKNYTSILEKLQRRDITPVIMSTTYARDYFKANENFNNKIDSLNSKLKNYALNNDITYIDLNKYLSPNHCLSPKFALDHVHLNDKAYRIWANEISGIIKK